ncbi:hypothetical protein RhiLY_05231 [Ceratobasidium sp. AG-Ba]|nr:hypothetical protein RhiLY_05231 [Ceratobasidium sp. AG-Ba]
MSMPSPSAKKRKGGWNTQNARFWDFEGNHPNILQKSLQDGPGGNPARTPSITCGRQKDEGGNAQESRLTWRMARKLWGQQQGTNLPGLQTAAPLDMTKSWNSVRAYAEFAYKTDAGLLPAIPVNLEAPEYRDHIDQADRWFDQEVRQRVQACAIASCRMCNVWNVANLSEDDVWILDDMVSTNGKYSLKALSQYEADFTGRYQRVKTMKTEGEEGEAWVAKNVEWVYSGGRPFLYSHKKTPRP